MSRYKLPVDAIITIPPTDPLAFMAAKMGFKVGTNSSQRKTWQHPENWNWAFPLTFLDCEFKKYNHELHLEACKILQPKYAVVRDIMTPEQCEEMGIEYFNFDTIMRFAQEIEPHTGNVILVPKYDCLSDIPQKYILGYSIPTKYAGTPLPVEMFRHRPVHLLGGSWKRIRALLEVHSNIISFDCNHLWRVSVYGSFCYPDGKQHSTKDISSQLTSPMYVAVLLSLNHIAYALHDIFETGENEKKGDRKNEKQPKLF